MSTTTSRAGLRKPDTIDSVNVVTDLNNNWDVVDLNLNFRSCTSATRPSTVWDGLAIHETDTNRQYMWNNTPASSGWYELYGAGGSIAQVNLSGATTGAFTLTNNVAGDTNKRVQVRADGRIELGSGSGATDTFVRRLGSNSLITDGALTVAGTTTVQSVTDSTALSVSGGGTFAKSLTVGGSASLGGGLGVLGLKDATTAPTSAPNNGVILYSQSSQPQWVNAYNNTYFSEASQPGGTVADVTNTTTETTLISVVIPANEIVQEGIYRLTAFGNASCSATATNIIFRTKLNGSTTVGLTDGAGTTGVTVALSIASMPWRLVSDFRFRSPGASANCWNITQLDHKFDGAASNASSIQNTGSSVSGPTFNSTASTTLSLTAKWAAANAANILKTQGWYFERIY